MRARDRVKASARTDYATRPRVRSPRILIAAADTRACQAMQRLLERETKMVVDVCDDLGNLIFQVRADRPDLVLLDWELPGRSALRLPLRGAGRWPPVIVLGQQAESEDVALACGARAFVNKAAPRETLLREVHSALNT